MYIGFNILTKGACPPQKTNDTGINIFYEKKCFAFLFELERGNPTVSDLSPGFYDVTLTITDNVGNIASDEMMFGATGVAYTQTQLDTAILNERLKYVDMNGDGKVGIEEAINALKVISGRQSE